MSTEEGVIVKRAKAITDYGLFPEVTPSDFGNFWLISRVGGRMARRYLTEQHGMELTGPKADAELLVMAATAGMVDFSQWAEANQKWRGFTYLPVIRPILSYINYVWLYKMDRDQYLGLKINDTDRQVELARHIMLLAVREAGLQRLQFHTFRGEDV